MEKLDSFKQLHDEKSRYKPFFILLLTMSLIQCTTSLNTPSIEHRYIQEKSDYYFPKRTFYSAMPIKNENYDEDQFRREWYSKHLIAMNEPSLSLSGDQIISKIRFLWLRSFRYPIAVRIEKNDKTILLFATELSGAGGYEPGSVRKFKTKKINASQYAKLKQLLTEIDFWHMSTVDSSDVIGLDGAQWIVEVNENKKYHVVDRWSPDTGKFKELCMLLLELSGFKFKKIEIY